MSSAEVRPPLDAPTAEFQGWKDAEKSKVAQGLQSEDSDSGLCDIHIPKNGEPSRFNNMQGHDHALQLRQSSQISPTDCPVILGQSKMNHEHRVTTILPVAEKVTSLNEPMVEGQALPQKSDEQVKELPLSKLVSDHNSDRNSDRKLALRTLQAACKNDSLAHKKVGGIYYSTQQAIHEWCAAHPRSKGLAPKQANPVRADAKTIGTSGPDDSALNPHSTPPNKQELSSESTDSLGTPGAPPSKQQRKGGIPPEKVQVRRAKNAMSKMKPYGLLLVRNWIDQRIRFLGKANPSSVA